MPSGPDEAEVQWLPLAGGTLRALTRGEGPRRVFLPALGGSYELYASLIAAFAERSRVTVIEPFGAGGSDDPEGAPTTRELAEAVVATFDALDLERFDLVGLSLGGMIAQWVAGLDAPRVRTLVLASTAPRGIRAALSGEVRSAAMARCLLEPDAEDATRCLAEGILEGRGDDATHAHVKEAAAAQPVSRTAVVKLAMAAARHDGREALERYRGPALVLSGELDTILPPAVQAQSLEHLVHGRQQILSGVGHDLGLEAPDRMAQACEAITGRPRNGRGHP